MEKQIISSLRKVQIFFVLSLLPLFSSCIFSMEERASFRLPDLNGDCSFTYVNLKGEQVWKNISAEDRNGIILLDVNKNIPFPLLVYSGDNLEVYGAIYPFTDKVTREDAFAASILLGLYSGAWRNREQSFAQVQDYLSYFNWSAFMKDCHDIEDIWSLDRQNIMENIAAGTFMWKKSLIRCNIKE